MDSAILLAVAKKRTPWLTTAAVDVTALGSITLVVLFSAFTLVVLLVLRDRLGALQLLAASAGAGPAKENAEVFNIAQSCPRFVPYKGNQRVESIMKARPKEKYMQRLHRYLGSLLVGAALIAPVGIQAKDKDRNCPDKGYYDRDHKDCHNWDDHENRAYQSWEEAQHKTHREFSEMKAKEQSEYWKWRHEHPDNDNDRH